VAVACAILDADPGLSRGEMMGRLFEAMRGGY
jgi:hypothetical protein